MTLKFCFKIIHKAFKNNQNREKMKYTKEK